MHSKSSHSDSLTPKDIRRDLRVHHPQGEGEGEDEPQGEGEGEVTQTPSVGSSQTQPPLKSHRWLGHSKSAEEADDI